MINYSLKLLIILSFVIGGCTNGEDIPEISKPTWQRKSNFPGGERIRMFSFSLNGKGYVGSGLTYDENGDVNTDLYDFWEYNPEIEAWTQKNDLPESIWSGQLGISGANKAFVINYGKIWEYNQSADSWTFVTSLPLSRFSCVGAVIGEKIYVGTGNGNNSHLNDWWEYDIELDKWTEKAPVPSEGRNQAIAHAINGKIYLGFGINEKAQLYDDFYEYDPISDSWTELSKPKGIYNGRTLSFVLDQKVYLAFPEVGNLHPGSMAVYDISNNSWTTTKTFPSGDIFDTSTFTIEDIAYVIGGTYSEFSAQVWSFSD
ncbi:Kelch repeat-containing protein [Flexithrix dorotheae]|uniref:Kelch repeat-containing protein n=1 Tax=Flexithrix dorotheae TaxID=70993 RepID=UPI00037334E0|nr:kelch repeat-containing protein [Flexithrix dorotheae]